MSSRLDLGPADLDRLEDALEDLELHDPLEHGGGPLDHGGDDPVVQRLVEYRQLLQWSRDALPLEEVPAGLLDGVLAQARQAAAAGAAAVAPTPSFWARWRLSVWVPTLAFAGSAALLLLVLVPKNDEPARAVADGAASKAEAKRESDGRLAIAELGEAEDARDGEGVVRGGGLAIGERAPEPSAAPPAAEQPSPPEEQVEEQVDEAAVAKRSDRRKSASTSKGAATGSAGALPSKPMAVPKAPGSAGGKSKPAPSPEPLVDDDPSQTKKDDEGGEDLWPEITRADADRHGGSCGLAKMRYDKLRKAEDPRVRARALAGLGLCEAAADSMGTAKKLFAQARAADPGVSAFIDRELASLEAARADAYDPSPAE